MQGSTYLNPSPELALMTTASRRVDVLELRLQLHTQHVAPLQHAAKVFERAGRAYENTRLEARTQRHSFALGDHCTETEGVQEKPRLRGNKAGSCDMQHLELRAGIGAQKTT